MHVKLFAERIPVHVPLVWRKPSLPRNRSADLASPAYNYNSDRAECAEDTALRSVPTDPIGRPEVVRYMCERTRRKETSRFSASLTSFQDAQSSSGLLLNCGVDITSCTLPTARTVECFVSDAWMLRTGWRPVNRCSLLWLQIRCSKHLTHFSVAGHIIMATTNSTVLLSQILDEYVVFRFVRAVKFCRHLKNARRCKIGSYCTPALTYQASWTFYSKISRCQKPGRCYVQGLR